VLAACGGGGDGAKVATFKVSASVTGLQSGTSAALLDSADEASSEVFVLADGSFSFPVQVPTGTQYLVSVAVQPAGQTCTVANGGGTINEATVIDVIVTCTHNTFSVAVAWFRLT
jgi:hypothetical protein